MSLIHLKNISKQYFLNDAPVQVLKNINLRIHSGDFLTILGTSGSGKSTLLNILGCLDCPSEGTYCYDNKEIQSLSNKELSRFRRDNIGFIFQNFNLIPKVSVLDNITRPLIYAGINRNARLTKANNIITKIGLSDRKSHLPSQLSGGQKQRVAIARALISNPKVILADEPTGNLDSNNSSKIISLLKQLNSDGHTVVMITHDREVARHSQRIAYLQDGVLSE